MIPNSAFITVGESPRTMAQVEQGTTPGAEFAVLRQGHFTKVLTMMDRGLNAASIAVSARFAAQAYRETWNVENVFLGEEYPGIPYLALEALARRRKRIAMLIHNVASAKRRIPLSTLRLARVARHLLCLSEQSREELVGLYGVPPERVTVIGSRVNTEFFRPDLAAKVLPQVCAAGVVNRDYGTLIEAVKPLGIPTKIAADTAWRYSARPVEVASVPETVEMRSWGNYLTLRSLYAQSAMVVVPLLRPMLSGVTVALEGMAMGKPVILSFNPYVREFLQDGENGFFVPAGDAAALREKIRFVLDHPQEAERMGARAREWVLERFTVPQYVARILGVWD